MDVVVMGSGIAGVSAAFHLSQSGLRVAVVGNPMEDAPFDGFLGAYHHDPATARLILAARDEFIHWGNVVGGSTGFVRTSLIHLLDKSQAGEIDTTLQLLREQKIKHQLLEAEGLGMQFPNMNWADEEQALWEPVAGYGDPKRCIARYLERVAGKDGVISAGETVLGLRAPNFQLTGIETTSGLISTEIAIFAPSASDLHLIPGLTLPVEDKRSFAQKLAVKPGTEGVPGMWEEKPKPLWIRPDGPQHVLVGGLLDDPNEAPRLAKFCRERIEERFPELTITDAEEMQSRSETCTIDGKPVVDRWSLLNGLYFAVAFGGLDFKTGPAIGKAIAEWITTDKKPALLEPLGIARFDNWFAQQEKIRVKTAKDAAEQQVDQAEPEPAPILQPEPIAPMLQPEPVAAPALQVEPAPVLQPIAVASPEEPAETRGDAVGPKRKRRRRRRRGISRIFKSPSGTLRHISIPAGRAHNGSPVTGVAGQSTLEIRQALQVDLEPLRDLVLEYVDFRNELRPDRRDVETLLRYLQFNPAAGKIFLAVSGSDILGFSILYFTFSTTRAQRVALLSDLYVRAAERGRGIGRSMFEVCVAFAKDNEFSALEWLANPQDKAARVFSNGIGGRAEPSVTYSI